MSVLLGLSLEDKEPPNFAITVSARDLPESQEEQIGILQCSSNSLTYNGEEVILPVTAIIL
jgi:hypothetical protein